MTRTLLAPLLAGAIAGAFAAPAAARPGEAGTDRFIVRYKAGSPEHGNARARQRALDAAALHAGVHLKQQRRLAVGADVIVSDRVLDHHAAQALLARLARDPDVEYAIVDRRMHALLTPNDPLYVDQWNYYEAAAGIRANLAWDTATGAGVVVAVVDTGITAHPDLDANIVAGYDFIADPAYAVDGDGRDADPHDPGDWNTAAQCDLEAHNSSWHGTHVAGTVAAVTRNGVGGAGVAFDAKVQPVRVLGRCGGYSSDIADAIVWASGGSVPGAPVNTTPAEVINLSLGGAGACDALTQGAIDTAVANGAVVVVAAGNDAHDASLDAPANCQHVITVGALARTGALADYSNFGPVVDLSAPGSAVVSTVNTGAQGPGAPGYAAYSGTSMATPHVAGIAALMQGKHATSPSVVETILKSTARGFAVACTAGCGTGVADAPGALAALATPFLYIDDAAPVLEGDSGTRTVAFTVHLSQAVGGPVSFNFATANGVATAGSDYVASSLTGQVIPAGSVSKTFNVTINGDGVAEADEEFFANVSNVSGVAALDTQARAVIVADEAVPIQNGVPLTDISGAQGTYFLYKLDVPAGATNLAFQTSGGFGGDVDMFVRANMSPTQGADCASTGPAGDELCTFAAPVAGTYFIKLYAYSNYSQLNFVGSYTPPAGPTLSVGNAVVAEGNSGTKTVSFTVSLSKPAAGPVTYNIATANSTAGAGSDYVARSLVGETIPAGQTSRTFTVTVNGDTTVEPNEVFSVNLSNASGAGIADGQGLGTILNDDGPTLSIGDASVVEGNAGTRQLVFTVSLSQAVGVPVTYTVATANTTAAAGTDYVARTLAGETIPAGQTSRTFAVTINGDTAVEASETFVATLSASTGVSILDSQGVGTIVNDDGAALTIDDPRIVEGNSGTKVLTFTLRLAAAAAGPVTYDIATANANATAGSDYVAKSLVGETIPAGQLSRVFQVAINGDTAVEANEVFHVDVSNVAGATLTDGQGSGVIINDDGATLSVADIATTEGNAGTKVVTFTVQLSQAAAGPVTYNIATADGPGSNGAHAGSDYVAKSLVGETIPAGMLSKTFSVTLNGDTAVEANELVYVNLSAVTGVSVLDAQANCFVVNDDGPTLSIGDVTATEGNAGTKPFTFTVSLSQTSAAPVTFSVASGNGTALAGSDYTAVTWTNLVIPAGMLSKTFNVFVNGDTTAEPDERFTASITSATGATIADATALGTITNDDP